MAGESNATIAAYLTEHDVGGGRFLSFRVPRLLANRVYLVEARSGAGVVNPDAHEPLVDERTFMLAQRSRDDGLRQPGAGRAIAPLAGIVRCAGCRHAMKSQKPSGTGAGVYRCPKYTRHGECPAPSTITKTLIEKYVVEQFIEHYQGRAYEAHEHVDDTAADRVLAAEHAYRAELENVELRNTIGAADHDKLIAALHREWQGLLESAAPPRPRPVVPGGVDVAELVTSIEDDPAALRELLGCGIQAVFVRPAVSRAHNLPVADRVKIVFADDTPVEIPRRGVVFEPRPFDWEPAGTGV